MKKSKRMLFLIMSLCVVFLAVGCGSSSTSSNEQKDSSTSKDKAVTLTVSAAASLKDSMNEIQKLYTKDHPNVTIKYNFGASGSLQKQIEQGAPVDVFMSAATKQMDELKSKNLLINDTVKNLLQNDVVLVVPKDSSNVKSFDDLASDKVQKIALGEVKSVPVGQYSQEVLTNLKLMDKVQPKAVYGKDVKEVLTWVETKNVDAGIVYKTDALVSKKVNIVATAPKDSHKTVIYPAAVIKNSKNADAAKEFLTFLSGDKAKTVFEKYGFKVGK
ncbi:molybdate ABC transporter substrate-binding protein [Clostridium sp. WLY-B-L2]|uniref:Molybdate ABC transporter substrate-binding protein n=1 Tax=Clostridium aromativorans TaxID=2836848 RepID=A0ABS8N791_9CLOT|nr:MULTISPECIES: molybdate ABC transporter substrate-binding protein [Clostridium]KAA8678825.1 molybdate ABC transporter substrate-binding protein [Clostridium sp. HV4-5-A1G]MCC9295546.1 molybdate ABC transporter substrate-binding protein [Clostridium aromativorans]